MLKLRAVLAVVALLLSGGSWAEGCETPYKDLLKQNNANISRLSVGMTKDAVASVMTMCTTKVHETEYSNPFRADAVQKGQDAYEVLYYLTRGHPPFTPIRESQATPVVLKNGLVVGWGQAALQSIR